MGWAHHWVNGLTGWVPTWANHWVNGLMGWAHHWVNGLMMGPPTDRFRNRHEFRNQIAELRTEERSYKNAGWGE